MDAPKVFFVYLRRPRRDRDDVRSDPFYEFGSFGCTKCHSSNLLHPRHAEDLEGARLAFVQGGDCGTRLVFLTPLIAVKVWADNCEARWTPAEMPFKYSKAPVLVANDGTTLFPLVKELARGTDCPSLESGLSSRLRSRTSSLPPEMARQVVSVYERHRQERGASAIASNYSEALPYITKIDGNRQATYDSLIRDLRAETNGPAIRNCHIAPARWARPSAQHRRSQGRTKRCT